MKTKQKNDLTIEFECYYCENKKCKSYDKTILIRNIKESELDSQICFECKKKLKRIVSEGPIEIKWSPAIGRFASLMPNEKKEYLKKRSQKHFKDVIANELREGVRKI